MKAMRRAVVVVVLPVTVLFAGVSAADATTVVVHTCYTPPFSADFAFHPPCTETPSVHAQVSIPPNDPTTETESITVTNPSSNPPNWFITSFSGVEANYDEDTGEPFMVRGSLGPTIPLGPANYCRTGYPDEHNFEFHETEDHFWCDMTTSPKYVGALGPGDSGGVHFDCVGVDGCSWDRIDVVFNYSDQPPGCAPKPPGGARAAAVAVMADEANCTTPVKTRIVSAKVNKKRRTAKFTFSAKHAKQFACLVQHNGKTVYHTKRCGRSKFLPKLGRGLYRLVVSGVNKVGLDPHPAIRTFVIP
jgi:hypothetical protein